MIDDWWLVRFDSLDETWQIGKIDIGTFYLYKFDSLDDKQKYFETRPPNESPGDHSIRTLKLLRRYQIVGDLSLDDVLWISHFLKERKVPVKG